MVEPGATRNANGRRNAVSLLRVASAYATSAVTSHARRPPRVHTIHPHVATSAKSAISSSPRAEIHSTAIGWAFGVSAKIRVASAAAPTDGSPPTALAPRL